MWRRRKFEGADRIAFNLVWLLVILIAISVVTFLRGCT
jgi:hypothetical protein